MKLKDVLRLLPVDVRGIGEEVLEAIACGGEVIDWNDRLELVYWGKPIKKTNFPDLLEYILYPEVEGQQHTYGFKKFMKGLKKIKLESQWIRNASVIENLDQHDSKWESDESMS